MIVMCAGYIQGYKYLNGSLPELHGDYDSSDSTDSLVEEAEQYLRSSIDCIVSGKEMPRAERSIKRRSSAPCPVRGKKFISEDWIHRFILFREHDVNSAMWERCKVYFFVRITLKDFFCTDSSPPRNWQPFLPHGIKDLRSDNWVKVIGPDSRIRGGRVRYVGYVMGQQEPYVGIELANDGGNSDGTFNNRRYFEWWV